MNTDDPLDRNISKLMRGARAPEPARAGAEDRVFAAAMARLASPEGAVRRPVVKMEHWAVIAAAAACVLLGLALFMQRFLPAPQTVAHQHPAAPEVIPPIMPAPETRKSETPPVVLATAEPHVLQINPSEDAPKSEKLGDGSTLEVAGGSRVEVVSWPDGHKRPELRIRTGSLTLNAAPGSGRVKVHSPAGDVTATGASFKVSVSRASSPPLPVNGEGPGVGSGGVLTTQLALSDSAPKFAMTCAVTQGEAIVRELSGTEQLLAAGETATLGSETQTLAENWRSGQLVPKLQNGQPGDPLEVRKHSVKATITEQIALVEVEETFFNPGDQRLEGTFYFPLPHDATICRLAMYVGDNLMEGEIAEAQRARRTFEALIVQQVDPALLEWAGGNMFKMRVFPIEPKSEKRVLISYYEVLKKDHNRVNFTYPLASDTTQKHPVGEIDIAVTVDSTPVIENSAIPAFPDAQLHAAANHLDATYTAKNTTPDKDFSLQYQTAKGQAQVVTVPFWHAHRNEGYFLMIFSPDLEQTASEKRRASDFVFVVDKSSGLGARQLALAVRTVKVALGLLASTDRFGIVAYDAVAQSYRPELLTATPEHLAAAGAWLDTLDAFGGSDLTQAWTAAAKLCGTGVTQIVYHGSGLSSLTSTKSGKLLADADAAFKGKDVRVHCLPVGAVQDATFLNELAKKYSGTVRAVKDADDAVAGASELLEDFSWPLYRNVQVDFGDLPVSDIFPIQLPNVTAGRQLFVFGKYKSPGDGALKLTASREGDAYSQELKVSFGQDASHSFVPKLWASQRIAQLQLDHATAKPEDSENIMRDIVETSKRYRVMSQFTSFIVLESAEDYLRFGIERRPDEFNALEDMQEELAELPVTESLKSLREERRAAKDEPGGLGTGGGFYRDAVVATWAIKSTPQAPQPVAGKLQRAIENDGLLASDIVVPNDLLAKAELGDHFETLGGKDGQQQSLGQGRGSFGNMQQAEGQNGGGRRLMVKRLTDESEKQEKASNGAADKDLGLQSFNFEIDTVAWERADIFPAFDSTVLAPLPDKAPHSTAKALRILNALGHRFESLALTVTQYSVGRDGKEKQQGRESVVALDFAHHAFASRTLGADFADVCDGTVRVRLFPQLKYAARRKSVENDVASAANPLPGYLCPWDDQLDHQFVASVDHDGEDGVILRLADRNNAQRYTLIELQSAAGPVQKIEHYERRWVNGKNESVLTDTIVCEEPFCAGGGAIENCKLALPTVYRTLKHDKSDTVVSVVRLTNVKVNFQPEAELFKAEIPADWAVRDLDAQPDAKEKHPLSAPVNPSPNFRR